MYYNTTTHGYFRVLRYLVIIAHVLELAAVVARVGGDGIEGGVVVVCVPAAVLVLVVERVVAGLLLRKGRHLVGALLELQDSRDEFMKMGHENICTMIESYLILFRALRRCLCLCRRCLILGRPTRPPLGPLRRRLLAFRSLALPAVNTLLIYGESDRY